MTHQNSTYLRWTRRWLEAVAPEVWPSYPARKTAPRLRAWHERGSENERQNEKSTAAITTAIEMIYMVSPEGFEPPTYGLGIYGPDPASVCQEKAYETSGGTHVDHHVGASGADELFLTRLVAIWQRLPEPIRRAIRALVYSSEVGA